MKKMVDSDIGRKDGKPYLLAEVIATFIGLIMSEKYL